MTRAADKPAVRAMRLLARAAQDRELSGTDVRVLIFCLDSIGDKTHGFWGYERIGEKLGAHRVTVIKSMTRLEGLGYLTCQRSPGGREKTTYGFGPLSSSVAATASSSAQTTAAVASETSSSSVAANAAVVPRLPESVRAINLEEQPEKEKRKKPSVSTKTSSSENHASDDDKLCETVLRLYHEQLPHCRRVTVRSKDLIRMIREASAQGIAAVLARDGGNEMAPAEFWKNFFGHCAEDPWLRGDVADPKSSGWRQSLYTILKPKTFAEAMDRAWDSRRAPAALPRTHRLLSVSERVRANADAAEARERATGVDSWGYVLDEHGNRTGERRPVV